MSASVNVVFDVVSTPATSVTFTPASGPFVAPLADGTVLGQLAVLPAAWNGTLTISGANAADVSINGSLQLVTSVANLAVGAYSVTITANP